MPDILLACANAGRIPLADGSVHVVVTSPPYYGLRSYAGTGAWEGGNPVCDHVANPGATKVMGNPEFNENRPSRAETKTAGYYYKDVCGKCGAHRTDPQIGLEDTPELYLERMVAVFREVKRVLRDDGIAWVNMGDSYYSNPSGWSGDESYAKDTRSARGARELGRIIRPKRNDLKPLDLMNIPARLVLALQADGWYHRSTIIWSKPNPMPESLSGWRWERCRVKVGGAQYQSLGVSGGDEIIDHKTKTYQLNDQYVTATWSDCPGCEKCAVSGGLVLRRGAWRPTTSHEYIFMLTKTDKYFADGEAVREAHNCPSNPKMLTQALGQSPQTKHGTNFKGRKLDGIARETFEVTKRQYNPAGRNARTVWQIDDTLGEFIRYCEVQGVSIPALLDGFLAGQDEMPTVWIFPTQGWPGAHFATFPEELPRRCLKASLSERGCCPKCKAAWARVVEKGYRAPAQEDVIAEMVAKGVPRQKANLYGNPTRNPNLYAADPDKTVGWLPTCTCDAGDPIPMIVLDPFCGSGTTGVVARELGHHFIGLDLSRKYLVSEAQVRLGLDKLRAYVEGRGVDGSGGLDGLPMFERGD